MTTNPMMILSGKYGSGSPIRDISTDHSSPICLESFSRRSQDISTRSGGGEGDLELGTKTQKSTTTSDTRISRLKILTRREIARVFQSVDNNEILRINQCDHAFHSRCLVVWFLKDKYDCPLCRIRYYPPTWTAAEAGLEI
ncbi:hypothetical protein GGR51DRAFT_503492 [Nemania sp. FL0031]|nr:hypothetical protein GGR51DRAFT_503492 [Nemania sp. FL0031]